MWKINVHTFRTSAFIYTAYELIKKVCKTSDLQKRDRKDSVMLYKGIKTFFIKMVTLLDQCI